MVFHFHQYVASLLLVIAFTEQGSVSSQSFDRAAGGLGRVHKPDWKLSELKRIFNTWQIEMAREGGWNSNY